MTEGEVALKKPRDVEIPADDPFRNDCLDRKESADRLSRLIRGMNQPFVMTVNGAWGTGKTTFIKMWMAHLQKEGNPCLYFNAWENDFAEDPLVPLIGEIHEAIAQWQLDIEKSPLREKWEEMKRIGAGVLRTIGPLAIRIATQGLLGSDPVKNTAEILSDAGGDIAEFSAELAEKRLKAYEKEKTAIRTFRKNLEDFASLVIVGEKTKRPVVFFIDELDRWRPTYAVQLLERIKHLFSVEGIVFVLAVDLAQLSHSVRCLYGAGMDADGYLRRFIDLHHTLDNPDHGKFSRLLAMQLDLEWPDTIPTLAYVSELFDLDLRTQQQGFFQLATIRAMISSPPSSVLTYFFLALRKHNPEWYNKCMRNELPLGDLMQFIETKRNRRSGWPESRPALHLEHSLLLYWNSENERQAEIGRRKQAISESRAEAVRVFHEAVISKHEQERSSSLADVFPAIELSRRIRRF